MARLRRKGASRSALQNELPVNSVSALLTTDNQANLGKNINFAPDVTAVCFVAPNILPWRCPDGITAAALAAVTVHSCG